MVLLKKLHINVLSVALLVTLVSYSGAENTILPQQFTSEYVVFSDLTEDIATYGISIHADKNPVSIFLKRDRQNYLRSANDSQNVDFKVSNFKGLLLMENRHIIDFQTEMSSFTKDSHTHFI